MFAEGGLPYVDAWEIKGPVTFYLAAIPVLLFDDTQFGLRLLDLVMLAPACVAAYRIVAQYHRRIAAPAAALLMVMVHGTIGYWHTAQPDAWAGFIVVVVLAILLTTRPSTAGAIAVGALLGLTVLVKPVYAVYGLLPLLHYTLQRRIWLLLPCIAAGLAMVIVLLLPWIVRDGLGELIDQHIVYPFSVYRHYRDPLGGAYLFFFRSIDAVLFLSTGGLLVAGSAAAAIVLIGRRDPTGLLLLSAALISMFCAILQQRFYSYHIAPLKFVAVVGFAMLCGIVLSQLKRTSNREPRSIRLAVATAFAIALVGDARVFVIGTSDYWDVKLGRKSLEDYNKSFSTENFSYAAVLQTAEFISQATAPDDLLYLWGNDAMIFNLSGRRSASRYGTNQPLVMETEDGLSRRRTELMQELAAAHPKAIVVQKKNASNVYAQPSDVQLQGFPALWKLIDIAYRRAYSNDRHDVYLRTE